MQIRMYPSEAWYAAVSAYGSDCPLDVDSQCKLSFRNNATMNQMTALLVSNHGRYVYAQEGFDALFDRGTITLDGWQTPPEYVEAGDTLRSAVQAFIRQHDQAHGQPIALACRLTQAPVYNTWIELTYQQNQAGILQYAHHLIENGFSPGTLIIDDGWSDYYGQWQFNRERFPEPRVMIRELKAMGFDVMLWLVPYISADSCACRLLWEKGGLLAEGDQPYILRWWNGASACMDLRHEQAVDWLRGQLAALMDMGIDGFKFDGGDSLYYLPEHQPDVQCHLWSKLASEYIYNEIRSDFNTQGMSIMERLRDKQHAWGRDGLASLIPDSLALGLGGHPILSPDMIGGGEYRCFMGLHEKDIDKELLLKNVAIAALMPVVQFSVNPARIWPQGLPAIHRVLSIRAGLAGYYEQLVRTAAVTKEPIIRYMEYVFAHQGLSKVTDQFMLGDQYLIAPLYEQGKARRQVILPAGLWKDTQGSILGDKVRPIKVESDQLLGVYERMD